MIELINYPEEELKTVIAEFKGDNPEIQLVALYLDSVKKGLLDNPIGYRSFGAFWWPVKRLLIESEGYNNEFGKDYDEDLNNALSFDDDELTIAAAYVEKMANVKDGLSKATEFEYLTKDEQEVVISIEDDFMEKLFFVMN